MNESRKLMAILFADVVDYSKLVSNSEDLGRRVQSKVRQVVHDAASTHSGRVVGSAGDGHMVVFESAVESVRAALVIHEKIKVEFGDLDKPVLLRVGIHTGDVIEDADGTFGSAVNVASRVQSMAEPGQTCITGEVFSQIRSIMQLDVRKVVSRPAKPLPEPVSVFSVQSGRTSSQANCNGALDSFQCMPRWLLPISLLSGVAVLVFFLLMQDSGNDSKSTRTSGFSPELTKKASGKVIAAIAGDPAFAEVSTQLEAAMKRRGFEIKNYESLGKASKTDSSIIVVLSNRTSVISLDGLPASDLKQKSLIGIGEGAGNFFGGMGLEISTMRCAHGVRGLPNLLIQSETVAETLGVESPVIIFDPPVLASDQPYHNKSVFGLSLEGLAKAGNGFGATDIIARFGTDDRYAPIVRQGRAILVGVNCDAGPWSRDFCDLIAALASLLARS